MSCYTTIALALLVGGASAFPKRDLLTACQPFAGSCSTSACCNGLQCNLYQLCVQPDKCKKKSEVCNPAKNDPYWHCCDGFACVPDGVGTHKCEPADCVMDTNCPDIEPFCLSGSCVQCFDDADCGETNVCHEETNTCRSPCDGHVCAPHACPKVAVTQPTVCVAKNREPTCVVQAGAAPCPQCDGNDDCAAGNICDKGSCVLAPEPEPECEDAKDCDGGLCPDKITDVPAQCRFGKCIFAPMKCPDCSGLKGVCKENSDCCEGGWCEKGKCEYVFVVTEQESTGEGATEVDDAYHGDQEVADTKTKNTGSADVFGFDSQGKTTTGGLTRGYVPFSGINASGGQSKSYGSFAIGTTDKKDADIVGLGAGSAVNDAKAIGKSTLTKTASQTYTAGNTGADNTSPAVVSGTHGISGAVSQGDGASEAGTKTDSKVALTDKWTIRTAGARSSNTAAAAGNAGSTSTTKGSTETGVADKKTYSFSSGSSASKQQSLFGRK